MIRITLRFRSNFSVQDAFRESFKPSEDEMRYYKQIDMKYRDRVKELKQNGGGEDEENFKIPEKVKIKDEVTNKEIVVKLKGLDFELLERERRKMEGGSGANGEQDEEQNQKRNKTLSDIQQVLQKARELEQHQQKSREQELVQKLNKSTNLKVAVSLIPLSTSCPTREGGIFSLVQRGGMESSLHYIYIITRIYYIIGST